MSISLYDNKVHFHTCLSMKFCPIFRSALAIRQTKHHEKLCSSLFITYLRIVSVGSESAITCQRARHRNAASRISPFKVKCAKHSFTEGSIHHLGCDEDVFTCIQSMDVSSVFENCKDFLTSLYNRHRSESK